MPLDLLDTPLRITWDLHIDGQAMAGSDVRLVLQRLLDAQVFFVTLEQSPLAHPFCPDILQSLNDRSVQVLLMCDGSPEEMSAVPVLADLPVTVLLNLRNFIDAGNGPDFDRIESTVETLRQNGIGPGLSLVPDKSNLPHLVSLLEFGARLDVPRFKLPNTRIDANFQQFRRQQVLRSGDVLDWRRNLPDIRSIVDRIDLEIHDLFLWEILTPNSRENRSEYGGCQAANSLAHIGLDATVYPCVSWPQRLGSLQSESFAELWASSQRHDICDRIAAIPVGCTACRDYHICFGGCRGLADVLATEKGLDPLCDGPR